MSLAITAAPIDSDNRVYNNDSAISKKRNAHNKTQKRTNLEEDFDSDKVNSVIQTIHRSSIADSSEGAELGDFKPISAGVENTKLRETFANKIDLSNKSNNNNINVNVSEYNPNDLLDKNTLAENFLNSEQVQDYYKRLLPTYQQNIQNNEPSSIEGYKNYVSTFNSNDSTSLLIDKLNYMINLLEEQKDERTNNITEEVVLYSFLGIFIIFIVDSFARVGKYTR